MSLSQNAGWQIRCPLLRQASVKRAFRSFRAQADTSSAGKNKYIARKGDSPCKNPQTSALLCAKATLPAPSAGEIKAADTEKAGKKKLGKSSWDGKRQGQKADDKSDFLSNLGSGQDYNINVEHGLSLPQVYC